LEVKAAPIAPLPGELARTRGYEALFNSRKGHRLRSVITRRLGGSGRRATRPLLGAVPHPSDVYLLCSDGFSDQAAHEQNDRRLSPPPHLRALPSLAWV